ncbi:MAG TPA: hypothetical protein VMF52_02280 [Steroidobacteraceae bacterium]|nr:hypothetical protein [Steroidobacteraceae bacterium]
MKVFAAAVAASLLAFSLSAAAQTATPVKGILAAQRFTLAEPGNDIPAGTLLVLDVDPALAVPRESLNPILYIEGQPATRLNHGGQSGHVLVIVPAGVDVNRARIWFGAPDVVEALTPQKIQAERTKADASRLSRARALVNVERPVVEAKDLAALLRDVAAPLIDRYSPQDAAVAAQWRLPEAN